MPNDQLPGGTPPPEFRAFMQGLARSIDHALNQGRHPPEVGFALVVFPAGGPPGSKVTYLANVERASMIEALRAWLEAQDAEPGVEPPYGGRVS